MMIKKVVLVILLIFLSGFSAGCWSHTESTEEAIVLGAGVDWTKEGLIRLTTQIASPDIYASAGGGGGIAGTNPASWVISAEGRTIIEAENYLAMKVPKDIYWGHCVILVIGEEMAKKGTGMVISFFTRDNEPRETLWFMVAKGEARDFLETYSVLTKTSAQAAGFLTRMKKGYSVQLKQFNEMLASKGVQPVATLVEVKEEGVIPNMAQQESPANKQVVISGTAVFKEDKLAGWLDEYYTRGVICLQGKTVKGAVCVLPSPGEPGKKVSITVRRENIKVTPFYDGENLSFDVNIRVEGNMVEQQSREDLAKPDKIKALEGEMEDEIKRTTTGTLEKAQSEFGEDIFGFGEVFHQKYKKEWRELKNRWDEQFSRANVNIVVKAHITDTGLLSKPVGFQGE